MSVRVSQSENTGGPGSVDFAEITGDPMDNAALAPYLTEIDYLSQNEYKVLYFQPVSASSGTITPPTGATILLDEIQGNDALVSTLDGSGKVTFVPPTTALGVVVGVTSFNALGAYVLSGTPSPVPVGLVYVLKIAASNWQNLTQTNIIQYESATVMVGATASNAGKEGLVPAPAAGDQNKILTGGGIWQTILALIGYTPENVLNKTNSIISFPTSSTQYPSTKGVVDYVAPYILDSRPIANNVASVQLTHTGTTAETIIYSILLPAGYFQNLDIQSFVVFFGATSNANNKTMRIRINTSNAIAGSICFSGYVVTTNTLYRQFSRSIFFQNSLASCQTPGPTGASTNQQADADVVPTTVTYDFSQPTWLLITGQLANAADTITIYNLRNNITRYHP